MPAPRPAARYAAAYARAARYARLPPDRLAPFLYDHDPTTRQVLADYLDEHDDPLHHVLDRHLGRTAYAGPGTDRHWEYLQPAGQHAVTADGRPYRAPTDLDLEWGGIRDPAGTHALRFGVVDPHEPVDPDLYAEDQQHYPGGRRGAVAVSWSHTRRAPDADARERAGVHAYDDARYGGLFTPEEARRIADGLEPGEREQTHAFLDHHWPRPRPVE